MIILDFETRSRADLKEVGHVRYGRHHSTDILCLALYDLDDDEKTVFDPITQDMPKEWRVKIESGVLIGAHNAPFDREIYEQVGVKEYGFPPILKENWYCTSAQMRVNALPAGLEDACIATKVTAKKDQKGSQLIRKLSIPKKDGTFDECPKAMVEMLDYCMKDVLATVDLVRATRMMTEIEHKDWLINEEINARGVKVDVEMATKAQVYAAQEQGEISEQLSTLTKGAITKPTQHQRIKKYILDMLDLKNEEDDRVLKSYMTKHVKGEVKLSLDKSARESILTAVDAGNLYLLEEVEELIRLLDMASMSSVSKFKRMTAMADSMTHRVHGAFIYAGASQTQRFASKGLQLHNMKRDCFKPKEAEEFKARMMKNEAIDNVMVNLSKLLRPALIPDHGHKYIVADWSAIEARAVPWLSGDPRAEAKLDLFRNDVDVYVDAAKRMNLEDRQIGKVAELALGFGGAVGAFTVMAKVYGVVMPEHQINRIVKVWRRNNPWCVDFWAKCQQAAINAVRAKGAKQFAAGRVVYTFAPALVGGTLLCILPCGTVLSYPNCRIDHSDRGENLSCLKASIRPKAGAKEWGRVRLWGGQLVENVAQAFCAGLLRDKLRKLHEFGMPIVGHVHDEVIIETEDKWVEDDLENIQKIMEAVPDYAQGLPLKAVPEIMERYGK